MSTDLLAALGLEATTARHSRSRTYPDERTHHAGLTEGRHQPRPGKLPGGPQIQQLLDGLGGWALFAALAGLLISVIVWAMGSFGGNYHAVSKGKTGVLVCDGGRHHRRWRRPDHQLLRGPRRPDPMTVLVSLADRMPGTTAGHPSGLSDQGCQWWNLACQGGSAVVDTGMGVITRSTAAGAGTVLGQLVKVVDESTQVPLADEGYRHIYYGFLGLAAPLIGVILCAALVVSALRRDPGALGRATVGIAVAGLGGAFYICFAQLLVALDNWLSHGIVRVTGQDLTRSITVMAGGFHTMAGAQSDMAANMMLLVLMMVMLLAGLILWFVLVLRKIAILVVVAFAPLLIAGYLWAPTRPWVRKATEVLIALVFTKTAIFGLFGIGLALLSRGTSQSLSDFVGTVVLLSGACFAPLLMLRLVHFAGKPSSPET